MYFEGNTYILLPYGTIQKKNTSIFRSRLHWIGKILYQYLKIIIEMRYEM